MAQDLDEIRKNRRAEYEDEIKRLIDYKNLLLKSLGEIEVKKKELEDEKKTIIENLRNAKLELQNIEWAIDNGVDGE